MLRLSILLSCFVPAALTGCEEDLLANVPDAAIDAPPLPPGNFECVDTPWTEHAKDPLAVSGVLGNWNSQLLGGATVEIYDGDTNALITQTTTQTGVLNAGKWVASIPTGGNARKIYRRLSAATNLDTYAYDAFPQFHEWGWGTSVVDPIRVDSWYQLAGMAPDPGKGIMYVEVWDCGLPASPQITGIVGATIEAPEGSRVMYWNAAGDPDPTLTATVAPYFGALIVGVTPGPTDVRVQAGPLTYRSWPVGVHANAMTLSPRHP